MSFHVLAPPAEIKRLMDTGASMADAVEDAGTQLAEVAKPVWSAAERLGFTLDVPGFLYAWLGGTRVMVEKDEQGEIITMGFLAVGKKWTNSDDSATLLENKGANPEAMMEFAKQIASAVGARIMFYEFATHQREDGITEHLVLGIPTG